MHFVFRKVIPIYITEEDSYEKDVLFYAHLGEPKVYGGERRQTIVGDQLVNGGMNMPNGGESLGWFDRFQANFSTKNCKTEFDKMLLFDGVFPNYLLTRLNAIFRDRNDCCVLSLWRCFGF